MIKKATIIMLIALSIFLFRCGEENSGPSEPQAPSTPSFIYDDSDPNNIVFTVTSDIEGLSINWDFGNGQKSSDSVVTVYYKSSGKYTVSLTVSNEAGTATFEKEIIVTVEEPVVPPAVPSFDADVNAGYVIYTITSETEGLTIHWDFGNGQTSTELSDSSYYLYPGTYTVTLTVANTAGATSYEEEVFVPEGDPAICENQDYILLTGGCDVAETGKSWKWDGASTGHRACGPPVWGASTYNDPIDVSWWEQAPNAFPSCVYDDEYTFFLKDFQYVNDCKGEFHWDWAWANELRGTEREAYQDTCLPYTPPSYSQWQLDTDVDGNKILTLTPEGSTTADAGSFLGCRMNPCVYQILTLEENYLYVRFEYWMPKDAANTGVNRAQWNYMKFILKN